MRKLIEQFFKFGVVGVIATLIDYAILMVLSQLLGIDPVVAGGISFIASLIFNYLASMRYVFSRREDLSRQKEFITFCILSGIGLIINQFIMWLGISVLGSGALSVTLAKMVATVIVMFWNFFSRKRWLEAN